MNRNVLMLGVSLLLVVGMSSAATISWSQSELIGAGDVSTSGTGLEALNFSAGADASVWDTTINGVTFLGLTDGDDNNEFLNPTGVYYQGASENVVPAWVDNYAAPPGLTAFDVLMSNFLWGPDDLVTLAGLTVGQDYLVQLFLGDTRAGDTAMSVGDLDFDLSLTAGTQVTGVFTADAETQGFLVSRFDEVHLNGYQLRAVPEPCTMALLSLGGLALLRKRK